MTKLPLETVTWRGFPSKSPCCQVQLPTPHLFSRLIYACVNMHQGKRNKTTGQRKRKGWKKKKKTRDLWTRNVKLLRSPETSGKQVCYNTQLWARDAQPGDVPPPQAISGTVGFHIKIPMPWTLPHLWCSFVPWCPKAYATRKSQICFAGLTRTLPLHYILCQDHDHSLRKKDQSAFCFQ